MLPLTLKRKSGRLLSSIIDIVPYNPVSTEAYCIDQGTVQVNIQYCIGQTPVNTTLYCQIPSGTGIFGQILPGTLKF